MPLFNEPGVLILVQDIRVEIGHASVDRFEVHSDRVRCNDRHGALIPTVEANILPATFGSEVLVALGLAVVGFALVLVLDRLANQK